MPRSVRSVVIPCPGTSSLVATGLRLSSADFAFVALKTQLLPHCPACGSSHLWSKTLARLHPPLPAETPSLQAA
jgi:hypothetical protein